MALLHAFEIIVAGVSILHFYSRARGVLDRNDCAYQSFIGSEFFVLHHMGFFPLGGGGLRSPPIVDHWLSLAHVLVVFGLKLKVGEFLCFFYVHLGQYRNIIYQYSTMDNFISCPVNLSGEQYNRLIARFITFGFSKKETKVCRFTIYEPAKRTEPVQLKPMQMPKTQLSQKFLQPIMKIKYPQYSFLAFGKTAYSDPQFALTASLTIVENSFENIFESSKIFSSLQEKLSTKLEIQIYRLENLFQFQLYKSKQSDEVLLIMKDLNANLEYDEKQREKKQVSDEEREKKERIFIDEKILRPFREICEPLLSSKDIFDPKKPSYCKYLYKKVFESDHFHEFMELQNKLQFFRTWMVNHIAIIDFLQRTQSLVQK